MLNVETIYDDMLKELNAVNKKERYDGNEKWFHVSSAGRCFKIHWYSIRGTEQDQPSAKQRRVFEQGNITHKSIQDAFAKKFGNKVFNEQELTIPRLNVRGFSDIIVPDIYIEQLQTNMTLIYDIKTMNAFSWRTKYGQKQNRKAQSGLAELQIGTYALALSEYMNCEKTLDFIPVQPIVMSIIDYKKDDSTMKINLVAKRTMIEAEQYWEEVKIFVSNFQQKEPKAGNVVGCPKLSWECNYCPYASKCNSPLYKGKKGE